MNSLRLDIFPEAGFFNMVQAWRRIVEQLPEWSIKPYQSNADEELVRKAGVVYFANRATLTVDLRLLQKAEASCGFSNFILAHEISHLELGHHSRKAVNLNVCLREGRKATPLFRKTNLSLKQTSVQLYFSVVLLFLMRACRRKIWQGRHLPTTEWSGGQRTLYGLKHSNVSLLVKVCQRSA